MDSLLRQYPPMRADPHVVNATYGGAHTESGARFVHVYGARGLRGSLYDDAARGLSDVAAVPIERTRETQPHLPR